MSMPRRSEQKIVRYLGKVEVPQPAAIIARATKIHVIHTYHVLGQMLQRGLVDTEGKGGNADPRRFFLKGSATVKKQSTMKSKTIHLDSSQYSVKEIDPMLLTDKIREAFKSGQDPFDFVPVEVQVAILSRYHGMDANQMIAQLIRERGDLVHIAKNQEVK